MTGVATERRRHRFGTPPILPIARKPRNAHPMPPIALFYEHPAWITPLFAALDRRGIAHLALKPEGHWAPSVVTAPAPVVFNRIAMSSFLRAGEHPIFAAMAQLDHWRRAGARVINGADVMAVDASTARQLSLISRLGLALPATRVVRRIEDIP